MWTLILFLYTTDLEPPKVEHYHGFELGHCLAVGEVASAWLDDLVAWVCKKDEGHTI